MRAVQIRAFGEPGIVLELADLPEPPAPTAGQVLIGVEHAPINMNDLYLIQGVYPVRPSLPSVVGNEGVGRVLAIGRGVDHLKVGDRVLVPLYSFSWRERLVAAAAGLFALPEADPRQLAMLGINPPTAALLLNESIDLRPGDRVAQNAANSGVRASRDRARPAARHDEDTHPGGPPEAPQHARTAMCGARRHLPAGGSRHPLPPRAHDAGAV